MPSSAAAAKHRQRDELGGQKRENESELNPTMIHGMLAGSWKTGIKQICFVAEGCLHLQLQLSPGKGDGFLVPGRLNSTE